MTQVKGKVFHFQIYFKYALLLCLLLTGVYLRLRGIQTREINGDETIYYLISIENTIQQLILISHKFKDHGILYFLLIKFQHFFIQDIPTLRIGNIGLFLVSAITLYVLLQRLKFNFLALFGVFLFSTHWHFVNSSIVLSPYNLVMPLAFTSIAILITIMQSDKPSLKLDLLFGFTTALSMYADYSFFYLFFLYFFLFILHSVYKLRSKLVRAYVLTIVLTLPGLIQFFRDFEHITILFERVPGDIQFTLQSYLQDIGQILLFRHPSLIGIMLIVFLITTTLFALFLNRENPFPTFFVSVILSLLSNIGLLYLVHHYIFPLYLPNSFWVFHVFVLFISLYFISSFSGGWKFIPIFVIAFLQIANIPGIETNWNKDMYGFKNEINSSSLINIMESSTAPTKIILYDPYFSCQVFVSYYFSKHYPTTDIHYSKIKRILNKNPEIIRLRHNNNLDTLFKPWSKDDLITIVLCDEIHKKPNFIGEAYTMYNNSFKRL